MSFGWTWEYIDDYMTLPRLEAINEYYNVIPPLQVCVAGIAVALGMEMPGGARKSDLPPPPSDDDIRAMMQFGVPV